MRLGLLGLGRIDAFHAETLTSPPHSRVAGARLLYVSAAPQKSHRSGLRRRCPRVSQIITRRGRQAGVVVYPVPASFQPYLAGPGRPGRRPDGAERLVLPADAAPLRRQRPQCPGPPDLRPRHGRPALTIVSTRKAQATKPDELHARPATVRGGSAYGGLRVAAISSSIGVH